MRSPLKTLAIALAALMGAAVADRASAMSFEKISGPAECAAHTCVLARGEIDTDTAKQFRTFIAQNKIERGALIVLNSPGGETMSSLKLGNMIRQARLSTTVRKFENGRFVRGGRCASACTYMFLGGVERSVGEGARLGVHQLRARDGAAPLSAEDGLFLMSLVATHVRRLCGDMEFLIPALRTPPGQVYWFSQEELRRYALVNEAPQQFAEQTALRDFPQAIASNAAVTPAL
jgi:hypothetical protein